MKTLHILDSSNYIYVGTYRNVKAIRGVREYDRMYVPNSAPVGGVTFMADSILNIMTSEDNDIITVWDRKPEKKRQEYTEVLGIQKSYKGQRKQNFDIFRQKEFAEKIIRYCGVPCAALDMYEADDLIYSIWKRYYNEYDYIRIHTEDSDLAFMVDEKTEIYPVKRDGRYINVGNYSSTVKKNVFIPYNLSILTKVIKGDPSDNIPGLHEYKLWFACVNKVMSEMGFKREKMGDIEACREVLLNTIKQYPNLPDAHLALPILKLVTPYVVSLDEQPDPASIVNKQLLGIVSGINKPTGNEMIENLLEEYLHEFNSNN